MLTGIVQALSNVAVPFTLLFICLHGYLKGVRIYEAFVEGAKEGFATAIRIIPFLVAMFVAIGIFRASGAMDVLTFLLSPLARTIGLPKELVPLSIVRPLSGTGSLEVLADIVKRFGPDSLIGRLASTMQASAETTFYVITLYFGSVGIKKIRHTLLVGLIADLAAILASIAICRRIFS